MTRMVRVASVTVWEKRKIVSWRGSSGRGGKGVCTWVSELVGHGDRLLVSMVLVF